jgi:hypothetical protein
MVSWGVKASSVGRLSSFVTGFSSSFCLFFSFWNLDSCSS